jgi:myo-inositol-1(or 4)-monophosphatase
LNETFWASEAFSGAWLNDTPIKTSKISEPSSALLATGLPYKHEGMLNAHLNIVHALLSQTHGIRRLGSAATDLAYVACGRLEGFYEYNLAPWDVAAGAYILQKAGGVATDFDGRNNFLFGKQLCSSNGLIQTWLLAEIRKQL